MSGPKRNPDRLNTIGIVVVGICGAVLVYVTIVALEAFYVNDTSEIQTMADYGGQDTPAKSLRAEQLSRINEYATNPKPAAPKANEAPKPQTYRIPIDVAIQRIVKEAKTDASSLIPQIGRSDKNTVLPIFGRPKIIPPPPAAPPPAAVAPTGPAATPGAGAGSAVELPAAPRVPTGAGPGSVTAPASAPKAGGAGGTSGAPKSGNPAGAPKAAGTPPKGNGK